MRLFNLFLLLILAGSSFAQIKQTPVAAKDIPASIKYAGHVINAVKFTDKQGDYLVITTETGLVKVKDRDADMEFEKADLYAYCYKIVDNKSTLYWQMHDFAAECPVHVTANYLKGTFAIADLDNNGIAEVWLMYLTGCRGDPSPGSLKIIMHQGNKKYAVRGSNRINGIC